MLAQILTKLGSIPLAVFLGLGTFTAFTAPTSARAESPAETRFSNAFTSTLGRAPTDNERAQWLKVAGESATFPTDSAKSIQFAYQALLHRDPTAEETSAVSDKLNSGTSFARCWSELASSPEAQFVLQFAAVARYVPSAEVRGFWVTVSGQHKGAGYVKGDRALASFPVNKNWVPFVDFTYRYLLGRAPSSEESKRDAARLAQSEDARSYWREIFMSNDRQEAVMKNPACLDLTVPCAKP